MDVPLFPVRLNPKSKAGKALLELQLIANHTFHASNMIRRARWQQEAIQIEPDYRVELREVEPGYASVEEVPAEGVRPDAGVGALDDYRYALRAKGLD